MKTLVHTLTETKNLANKFVKTLHAGDVVLLNGDLGAGKTTFTQFAFKALGVKDVVNSPTFSILKTYNGKFLLHHIDAYRITTEEAIAMGFDELFNDKNAVFFIEWSENIKALLPKKTKKINITFIDNNTREFEINE